MIVALARFAQPYPQMLGMWVGKLVKDSVVIRDAVRGFGVAPVVASGRFGEVNQMLAGGEEGYAHAEHVKEVNQW